MNKIHHYQLHKIIGQGSFGTVYQAYEPQLERWVALKIIHPLLVKEPNFLEQFESEARIIANLEHRNILPLYSYGQNEENIYYSMRLVRGGTLRHLMQRCGKLSLHQALDILRQIFSAVIFSHQYGVIHGDVKPENILLDQDETIYLADFSIAQVFKNKSTYGASPAYAPPEQLKGTFLTPQSDQYAIAIVLFEMLTAQHPFPNWQKQTLRELIDIRSHQTIPKITDIEPELPSQLNHILKKASASDYRERYSNLKAFWDELEQVCLEVQTSWAKTHHPNPYKGLRPYQQNDSSHFFGQDALIDSLFQRLTAPQNEVQFLILVGSSGSGKSSAINAGLIPAAKQAGWLVADMQPGVHPVDELSVALTRITLEPSVDFSQILWADKRGLLRLAKLILPDHTPLLLVIDQFEELYTLTEDPQEQSHFLELLCELVLNPHNPIFVLLAVRADFYQQLLRHPILSRLLNDHTQIMQSMSPESLEQAIVLPAKQAGVNFENGLIGRLIAEASHHSGALPILEYTLTELYDHKQGNTIWLRDFEALGGMAGALKSRANKIYHEMDESSQALTRQIFLRLVRVGDDNEYARRCVSQNEFSFFTSDWERSQSIIQTFSRYRLLTLDFDPLKQTTTIEIAHDALLHEWELLQDWLETHRQDIQHQRFLATNSQAWLEANQSPDFLLAGGRLGQFEAWANSSNLELTHQEKIYLEASLSHRQQEFRAEMVRQEREHLLEKRLRLFFQRLLLTAALAIVLLSAFSLALVAQRRLLEEQRDTANQAQIASETYSAQAQSLALAANAQLLKSENISLSRALALQATQMEDPPLFAQHTLADVAYEPSLAQMWRNYTNEILYTSFSADGQFVYIYAADGTFIRREVGSERILIFNPQEFMDLSAAVISADGRLAAYISAYDTKIFVQDLEHDRIFSVIDAHVTNPSTLAFSPDGKYLVSAGYDNRLTLWDVASGEAVQAFQGHLLPIRRAVFMPDGEFLLSCGYDLELILWQLNGQLVRRYPVDESCSALAVSLSGKTAIIGQQTITQINLISGSSLKRPKTSQGEIKALAISPDERLILSADDRGEVVVWDSRKTESLYTFADHQNAVTTLAFSPNGQWAISGSADGNSILWNLQHGALVGALTGHTKNIWSVAISPIGDIALSGSADNQLVAWDMKTLKPLYREDFGNLIYSIDFSADGTLAALGTRGGDVILWDVLQGQRVHTWAGHRAAVYTVAISPDQHLVASADRHGVILVWNTETEALQFSLIGHQAAVYSLAFSPDGKMLLSGSQDRNVILWDITSQEVQQTWQGHQNMITSVAFSPDSRFAVSGSLDKTLILWDVQTGQINHILLGHTAPIWDVTFSPDGKTIASASADQSIILWDVQLGQTLRTFVGMNEDVRSLAFSPNGKSLLAGGNNGSLLLWRVDSLAELKQWILVHYDIPILSCEQFNQYGLSSQCFAR